MQSSKNNRVQPLQQLDLIAFHSNVWSKSNNTVAKLSQRDKDKRIRMVSNSLTVTSLSVDKYITNYVTPRSKEKSIWSMENLDIFIEMTKLGRFEMVGGEKKRNLSFLRLGDKRPSSRSLKGESTTLCTWLSFQEKCSIYVSTGWNYSLLVFLPF